MTTQEKATGFTEKTVVLSDFDVESLLTELPSWGKVTVIIIHAGSVFEFKGPFPKGSKAHGFYNLNSGGLGFEGHLNIDKIDIVELQSKLHRGRPSFAIIFKTDKEAIFKVFLGRDEKGEIFPEQMEKFSALENLTT